MAVSLLTRFLEHYDPLFLAATAKGAVLGTDLMSGVAGWCVPGGMHVLYRGDGATPSVDYDLPVGTITPSDAAPTTIENMAGYPFSTDTVYWFGLRALGFGGAEEENADQIVRIETDDGGVPISPVPNPPIRLAVAAKAGGKFVLQWQYSSAGEQVAVSSYNIYHDNGDGTVDWDNPIGGTSVMAFATGAYTHGNTIKFGVRSVSADGDEETNTTTVSAVADDTGPDDIEAPLLTRGAET